MEGDREADSGDQTNLPPPGWYRDPLSTAEWRYWDGRSWTNEVRGAQSAPPPAGARRRSGGQMLAVFGGIGLAVSPFLPWANVFLLGRLNLFQLYEADGRPSTVALGAVVAGGAVALVAWTDGQSAARAVGLSVGLLGGAIAALLFLGLLQDVREAHGLARVSYGPWVALASCVAVVVGSLMLKRGPRLPKPPRPPS